MADETPPSDGAAAAPQTTAPPAGDDQSAEAARATRTGAEVYALYFKAAEGKNHLNEALPWTFADLTESRQMVWDLFAESLAR